MIDECLRVTFEVEADGCPLSDASGALGVPIEAQPPQLRTDGNVLLKFSAPPREDLREYLDEDDRIRFLHVAEADKYDIYRCLSRQPCIVHELIDGGLLVDTLQYREQKAIFYGAIVDREILKQIVDRQDVSIKLRNISLVETEAVDMVDQLWNVTDRQEDSLRTAVEMGYFALPREADAADVAAELGISKSAFLERLRRAEREIFGKIFL